MIMNHRLKIAGHLARSQHAIQELRDNLPLKDPEWVLNLFNYSKKEEDSGKLSFMLMNRKVNGAEDLPLLKRLIDFDQELTDNKALTSDDYQFILKCLLEYRTYLIEKFHQCTCEF